MRPGYVRSLEDYWLWLDALADESGGWLQNAVLVVRPIEPWPEASPSDWIGLVVERQYLDFGDDTALHFGMVVADDFVLTEYSFHYQDLAGNLIWRKDKHPGHEWEVHIHQLGADEPGSYREVDLQAAIAQVHGVQAARGSSRRRDM